MTTIDTRMFWYNYKIGAYEQIETPTDFINYIPQSAASQNLYALYIQTGDVPLEAAHKVLMLHATGKKD